MKDLFEASPDEIKNAQLLIGCKAVKNVCGVVTLYLIDGVSEYNRYKKTDDPDEAERIYLKLNGKEWVGIRQLSDFAEITPTQYNGVVRDIPYSIEEFVTLQIKEDGNLVVELPSNYSGLEHGCYSFLNQNHPRTGLQLVLEKSRDELFLIGRADQLSDELEKMLKMTGVPEVAVTNVSNIIQQYLE